MFKKQYLGLRYALYIPELSSTKYRNILNELKPRLKKVWKELKSNTPLTKSLWRKVLHRSQLNVRNESRSSRKFGKETLKNKTPTPLTLSAVTSKATAEISLQ